jgi:hypothetical protein
MFRRILHHPQGELLSLAQKLSAYCNAVTLVTKHKFYHMWVLQRYLQLLEQIFSSLLCSKLFKMLKTLVYNMSFKLRDKIAELATLCETQRVATAQRHRASAQISRIFEHHLLTLEVGLSVKLFHKV